MRHRHCTTAANLVDVTPTAALEAAFIRAAAKAGGCKEGARGCGHGVRSNEQRLSDAEPKLDEGAAVHGV